MMTHIETSYQMGYIVKLAKLLLEKYGYFHPIITILNKGKDLSVTIKQNMSNLLLDQKTYIVIREGVVIEQDDFMDVPHPEDIFITVLMFKLYIESDEDKIIKLLKDLTVQYDPDSIAYLNCGVYNEYSDPKRVTDTEVINNPDSVRVISCCYYTREDPKVRRCILPYINKGKIETGIAEDFSIEDPDPRYAVLVSDCSWFGSFNRLEVTVKCPYPKQRS
jgi:hypothetical protein